MDNLYFTDQLRELVERLSDAWYAMAYRLRRLALPPVDSATHGLTRKQLDAILPLFAATYYEPDLSDELVLAFDTIKHGKRALRFGPPIQQAREFSQRRKRLLHSFGVIGARIPQLRETTDECIKAVNAIDHEILMPAIVLENCDVEAA